jgi:hypothetical protein
MAPVILQQIGPYSTVDVVGCELQITLGADGDLQLGRFRLVRAP